MNEELKEILQTHYQYGTGARIANAAEAEVALQEDDMPYYFDLNLNIELADSCWALERWDEAKYWYRHNARVMLEQRNWHLEHSGPNYPIEATSDWMSSTFIKAGDLEVGQKLLDRAIAYWKDEPDAQLVLTRLGLHAAQANLAELAKYAACIIAARQELPGGTGSNIDQARKILHYEPAQVSLLLGQWDEFLENTNVFSQGARLVEDSPSLAFPDPMQNALVSASYGLQTLALLYVGEIELERGRELARQAFEEAMLHFYRFSGQVDWNLYFMRLNTRFADELAASHTLNPNPFASDVKSG
ncbi:hypothetical protein NC981_09135 [Leptolyngbya sp. DQ-M1]|uniref:hypothetical protein n=1 Tax=Leptolyngbya sp. DQ-M1 TaxID=2933920 RepID=UPI003299BBE3